MEFFDIHYCHALIESNKSEDVSYKIEEIKNINNKYINELLRIEIKLKFEKLENISKYKKNMIIIIKNLMEIYLLKKNIKNYNTQLNSIINNNFLQQNKLLSNNTDDIINNIMDNIENKNINKYKLSISKLQTLFKFKINKKNKYIYNLYYNDLKHKLNIYYKEKKDKEYLYDIKILIYKISQIYIKNQLTLEINEFIKNKKNMISTKNKLNTSIKKNSIKITKLMSSTKKHIKLYKKKQNEFSIKIKKLYLQFLVVTKVVKNNQNIIDRYKEYIKLHKNKKKITNNMNKNYNKCKKFNINNDIICSICLEQIEEGISTSCNHTFHLECINLYVNNSLNQPIINIICPMCRAYI